MSRLLLVGWDAADWKVIDPLLAKGEMPHLARLLEQGVRWWPSHPAEPIRGARSWITRRIP
jgi:predicted AlkP superfamily phosphohydrolase/phosphomutase